MLAVYGVSKGKKLYAGNPRQKVEESTATDVPGAFSIALLKIDFKQGFMFIFWRFIPVIKKEYLCTIINLKNSTLLMQWCYVNMFIMVLKTDFVYI